MPSRNRPILYVTFDGLLQPLGQSQVLAYVELLARRGFNFIILSLERPADLQDAPRLASLTARLQAAGIEWASLPYRTGNARAMIRNLAAALSAAWRISRRSRPAFVHARSYPPAAIAWILGRTRGIPYLFDMRGYWIDEKKEQGRWFTHPAVYRPAKKLERLFVRDAAGVVTLTQLQAGDLAPLRPGKPTTVIPTCADFARFKLKELNRPEHKALAIGYVGSLNATYCVDESFALFKHVWAKRADSRLLCLTQQPEEAHRRLTRLGLPTHAYSIARVPHGEMPAYLTEMDWGLALSVEAVANRGSLRTKLAEFLAVGVRPVQYGCNQEESEWVRKTGSGLVLADISDDSLRAAAAQIARSDRPPLEIAAARELGMAHFGLDAGVGKYAALYNAITTAPA